MKLASFIRDGHARFGAVLHGERVMDLKAAAAGAEPAQLAALEHAVSFLEAGPELMELAREHIRCGDYSQWMREVIDNMS